MREQQKVKDEPECASTVLANDVFTHALEFAKSKILEHKADHCPTCDGPFTPGDELANTALAVITGLNATIDYLALVLMRAGIKPAEVVTALQLCAGPAQKRLDREGTTFEAWLAAPVLTKS